MSTRSRSRSSRAERVTASREREQARAATQAPIASPAPATETRSRRVTALVICAALFAATVIAYWPVRHNGFVDFDDPGYVTTNRHVRAGLRAAEVKWAFSNFYFFNYH